jgi:hypothetical protein
VNKINSITELKQLINSFDSETEINLLVYELSNVKLHKALNRDCLNKKLCELENNNKLKFDEIIEVRIFNSNKELFLFQNPTENIQDDNNGLTYVFTNHNNGGDKIIRTYMLESRLVKKYKYKTIKVIEYVDYEDNLAYVRKTCLLDIVRGEYSEK